MSDPRDNIWTSIRNLKNSLTSRSLSQRDVRAKSSINNPQVEESLQINSLSFTYEMDQNNQMNQGFNEKGGFVIFIKKYRLFECFSYFATFQQACRFKKTTGFV